MHFTKEEIVGISVSLLVVVALFAALKFDVVGRLMMLRMDSGSGGQTETEVVSLGNTTDQGSLTTLLSSALSGKGKVEKLITQDSTVGEGAEVVNGSRVTVQYIGMLQDGTQFDNSYERGEPYTFVIGRGEVIKGWDMGLLGMKAGGERILVIPADMAYGDRTVGTIPANSTLLFAVEVVAVE